MASQSPPDEKPNTEWTKGSICEIYCDYKHEWINGEVIGTFTYEDCQFIRVKYADNKRTRDIRSNDPHIRPRNGGHGLTSAVSISNSQMDLLKELAIQRPEFSPLWKSLVAQSGHSIGADSSKS